MNPWTSTAGPRQTKNAEKALDQIRQRGRFHIEITDHGRHCVMPMFAPVCPAAVEALDRINDAFGGVITAANYQAIIAQAEAAYVALVLPEVDNRSTPEEKAERAAAALEREAAEQARRQAVEVSKARFVGRIPTWADALIVAELDHNTSDSMSDYHNHETSRRVLIGFRRGQREDFRQLRAAAATYPETAHLGPGKDDWSLSATWDHASTDEEAASRAFLNYRDSYWKGDIVPWHFMPFDDSTDQFHAPHFSTEGELDAWIAEHQAPAGTVYRKSCEHFEHREVYSMGAGNYLKNGHDDANGWKVSSEQLCYLDQYDIEDGLPQAQAATSTDASPAVRHTSTAYTVQKHHHTKRGFDFFLVVTTTRTDRDTFEIHRASCEAAGGWYSRQWGRTPGGFAFKVEADAKEWASRTFAGETAPEAAEQAPTQENASQEPSEPAPAPAPAPATATSTNTLADQTCHPFIGRFRDLADRMQKDIDHALRPMTQNPTPKRCREYNHRRREGEALENVQRALRALANAYAAGLIQKHYPILAGLRTKADVAPLVRFTLECHNGEYYSSGIYADKTPVAVALQQLMNGWPGGAETAEQVAAKAERDRLAKIERMEHEIRFLDIPGFFPTPRPVIERMLDEAGIEYGNVVLEPSAGKGDIADAIGERYPHNGRTCVKTVCIERNHKLRDILHAKSHELHPETDFLECPPIDAYDVVLMNPPFERGADADHVKKAFQMVKPGGRIVAIMSSGTFSRSDRKATEFREWLDEQDHTTETLDAGTFTGPEAFRQTSVSSVMVVINKPAEVPVAPTKPQAPSTRRAVELLLF